MNKGESAIGADAFQMQLSEAKRHCLISLLDYADELKKQTKDEAETRRIERLKKRIHNDIGQFHQTASNLLELRKTGGQIIPFGRVDAKNRDTNNPSRKSDSGKDKKKIAGGGSPKPEGSD